MKQQLLSLPLIVGFYAFTSALERRPIDNKHPMWMIHVDHIMNGK